MPQHYEGYDHVLFDRHAQTTMAKHLAEIEEAHTRSYPFAAQLEARGRNVYNSSGRGLMWDVQYRIHDVTSNNGANRRNYAPKNLWKKASLTDGGFEVTDEISKREVIQNRNQEAMINVFGGFMNRMTSSLKQVLGRMYWIDRAVAANSEFWDGIDTMFATNGTLNVSAGTQRTANQADLVGYPYATYAGLSTELGAYGGSNYGTDIWPNGDSDPEYDFWTPIVVVGNSTNTLIAETGNTWAVQALNALRYGITQSKKYGSSEEHMTTGFMARDMFLQAKNLIVAKEEIQVTRGDKTSLISLGFRDVFELDGVEFVMENGVPSGYAYGVPVDTIEYHSYFNDLIEQEGPVYDMDTQSHKAVISTLGNLKFMSPRNYCMWVDSHSKL